MTSVSSDQIARAEIIVDALTKVSELLHAYKDGTEVYLCGGGIEISNDNEMCGAFMSAEGGPELRMMLVTQLSEYERGMSIPS